jgi:hypothetical protein
VGSSGKLNFELRDGRPLLMKPPAQAEGWTIVDMKNDWKRVFSFEGK